MLSSATRCNKNFAACGRSGRHCIAFSSIINYTVAGLKSSAEPEWLLFLLQQEFHSRWLYTFSLREFQQPAVLFPSVGSSLVLSLLHSSDCQSHVTHTLIIICKMETELEMCVTKQTKQNSLPLLWIYTSQFSKTTSWQMDVLNHL